MANYHQDFDSFYKTNAKDYLKFKQRKHLVELKNPAFNYSMFFRPRINMTCPSLKRFKDLC